MKIKTKTLYNIGNLKIMQMKGRKECRIASYEDFIFAYSRNTKDKSYVLLNECMTGGCALIKGDKDNLNEIKNKLVSLFHDKGFICRKDGTKKIGNMYKMSFEMKDNIEIKELTKDIKEFNPNDYRISDYVRNNRIAINCSSEKDAKQLLEIAHNSGGMWINGDSYLEKINWNEYKKDTCYCLNGGRYGHINYYVDESIRILFYELESDKAKILTKIKE